MCVREDTRLYKAARSPQRLLNALLPLPQRLAVTAAAAGESDAVAASDEASVLPSELTSDSRLAREYLSV